ncbi:phosphomethylpyrimidine synthase ThiC [Candidatus Bipolaricaulota sp. J31]
MSTQLEAAWRGTVTPEMEAVARAEGISPAELRERIARGEAVILKNRAREIAPVGIGKGLRTKVNANVGTPPEAPDPDLEVRKAVVAWRAGADTLMDLSLGGDLPAIRRRIMEEVPIPLGTVPVYQAAMEALRREGTVVAYTADELLAAIEAQAREGVDFMTVHCGVTRRILPLLERSRRLTGVVSRGGALHIDWMIQHGQENPLYARFDDLLEIARSHDVVLSLGDGLRPGSLADAGDPLQVAELMTLGELVERAREAGVQVMVEGPGHVPLPDIEAQVRLAKSICRGAPFYVLGPLPTDIAAGHDHIAAAVGGALAAWAGADFLCYVTPAEHLGVPTEEEVRIGVIAARIAAHIADVAVLPGVRLRDERMSRSRGELDWEGMVREALDPELVRKRAQAPGKGPCALCGELCPMSARRSYRELIGAEKEEG